MKKTKLALGRLVATPGVLEAIPNDEMLAALRRHTAGDWGDVGPEDWNENDLSVEKGSRVLSSYRSTTGEKFWIITEADRSSTCVLLPSEY